MNSDTSFLAISSYHGTSRLFMPSQALLVFEKRSAFGAGILRNYVMGPLVSRQAFCRLEALFTQATHMRLCSASTAVRVHSKIALA